MFAKSWASGLLEIAGLLIALTEELVNVYAQPLSMMSSPLSIDQLNTPLLTMLQRDPERAMIQSRHENEISPAFTARFLGVKLLLRVCALMIHHSRSILMRDHDKFAKSGECVFSVMRD